MSFTPLATFIASLLEEAVDVMVPLKSPSWVLFLFDPKAIIAPTCQLNNATPNPASHIDVTSHCSEVFMF